MSWRPKRQFLEMETEFQLSGKNRELPWKWTGGDGEFHYEIPEVERLAPSTEGDRRDRHDRPFLEIENLLDGLKGRTLEEVIAD